MTRAVNLALNDDAVAVVAVVVRDQEGQNRRDEEEDDVPGYDIRTARSRMFARELT
jgi:hypothetical protein